MSETRERRAGEWIDVRERLPAAHEDVLIWWGDHVSMMVGAVNAVERLTAERDEARAFGELAAVRYNALLAGRILTCIYCGHEFPQDTPASGADILKAHAETCELHPMAALRIENGRMRTALLWVEARCNGIPHLTPFRELADSILARIRPAISIAHATLGATKGAPDAE